jgi:hypothetical protein
MKAETARTQLRTQILAELREVLEAGPKLLSEFRAAVLPMTRAVMS